jgi:uncharacterized pyridoxal phosphate-containing UPF0001 family protein
VFCVSQAAGHEHALPRLVAVSKFKSVEAIKAAYDAGQRVIEELVLPFSFIFVHEYSFTYTHNTRKYSYTQVFGENYAQELLEKSSKLPSDIQWHMIGHVQTSNVKHIVKVPNLAVIETIDCEKVPKLLVCVFGVILHIYCTRY